MNLFLSQYPEQIEAHLERFNLLRSRLPQPRLEDQFRLDAEAALLAISAEGTWSPSADGWANSAQRVLPKLEEKLRQWPSDLGAWKAWIAWSELTSRKPKAVALAATLEPWPKLRFEAAQLIASQLRNRGDWKDLQAFAQDQWDALVEKVRPIHPAIPPLDSRLADELDTWLAFLEDALLAQGQADAARPLRVKYLELTLRKHSGQ
jgi:hypothetical protein